MFTGAKSCTNYKKLYRKELLFNKMIEVVAIMRLDQIATNRGSNIYLWHTREIGPCGVIYRMTPGGNFPTTA